MKNIFMAICLLAALTTYAQADSLYRWLDKDGKVHYGDRPAEDAIGAEQKKFAAPAAAGDDELSYTVRKAKQDFPVTLYVAPNCGDVCVQARSLLNKRGIPFAEKNLVSKEEVDAFKAKTGVNSVPVLAVGKSILSGFEAGTTLLPQSLFCFSVLSIMGKIISFGSLSNHSLYRFFIFSSLIQTYISSNLKISLVPRYFIQEISLHIAITLSFSLCSSTSG